MGILKMKKYLFHIAYFVFFGIFLSLPGEQLLFRVMEMMSKLWSEMIITASDNSIFEHQSFNVAPNETVRFVSPQLNPVLNRVVGAGAKSVFREYNANGRCLSR